MPKSFGNLRDNPEPIRSGMDVMVNVQDGTVMSGTHYGKILEIEFRKGTEDILYIDYLDPREFKQSAFDTLASQYYRVGVQGDDEWFKSFRNGVAYVMPQDVRLVREPGIEPGSPDSQSGALTS